MQANVNPDYCCFAKAGIFQIYGTEVDNYNDGSIMKEKLEKFGDGWR